MNRTFAIHAAVSTAGLLAVSALLAGCQRPSHQADENFIPPTALIAVDTSPPDYPLDLACSQVGGSVELLVTVGPEGTPTDIRVARTSKVPALDASAEAAVRNWKFRPATRNGQPTTAKLQVPVKFTPPAEMPEDCPGTESESLQG
ncbi:energy transducer TonB [Aerolutibacter ruishenii]|uniref:Protein TonB n=1 Tax=Aerolutibacter ruishenii TaxID=686800 RepID=A0A562LVM7_9GAMM|nr:energy transducer TonB [Lysobacter ruishenii]TWI11613.1 protein TonB [Lysobacter ruishenii]